MGTSSWQSVLIMAFFVFADPPTSKVRLGSSLNASNIKEGDDVYFECEVVSNPPPNMIVWMKDVSWKVLQSFWGYSTTERPLQFYIVQIKQSLLDVRLCREKNCDTVQGSSVATRAWSYKKCQNCQLEIILVEQSIQKAQVSVDLCTWKLNVSPTFTFKIQK